MGFFDEDKNVREYIKMVDGYDGAELIKSLQKYLPEGSTLLELGMGPGKDLDILRHTYKGTGSDSSQVFVDRYKKKNKEADVVLLDAAIMDVDRKFDCIYSNKVLHHLTKSDLKKSFLKQEKCLESDGLLFHSFWYGDKIEEHNGLRFVYYIEESLKGVIGNMYDVINFQKYTEFDEDDSFYVVLKRKNIA